MKDYYAILETTPQASRREIRAAYRQLAFQWHPDRNPEQRDVAHRRFLDLGEALSVLQDARGRVAYDLEWQRHFDVSASRDLDPVVVLDFADEPADDVGTAAPAPAETTAEPPTDDRVAADCALKPHEFRAQVHALARDFALTDPRGRRVDRGMALLVGASFLVSSGLSLLVLVDLVSALRPPWWAAVLAWLTTAVCAAWAFAFRESRVERHRPLAEEVLKRRGLSARG